MKSVAIAGAIALTVAGGAVAKPALSEADYLLIGGCKDFLTLGDSNTLH